MTIKRSLVACISALIIGLTACEEKEGPSLSGKLRLSLKADTTSLNKGVGNVTKALSDEFEEFLTVDDYRIMIMSGTDTVKSYDRFDAMPDEIELPEGAYSLTASKGDNLPAAFENPYFEGTSNFSVKTDMSTPLDVTCTLGNARITVEYTDDFKEAYGDYTVLLSSPYTTTDLEIKKGESRPAYMQVDKNGSDVAVGIRLKKKTEDTEKTYYIPNPIKLERRQNVRLIFKTDGSALEGIGLVIMLDDTMVEQTFTTDIPNFMWQQFDVPTLSAEGFIDDELLKVKVSAVDENLSVGFNVPGGLKSFTVKYWNESQMDEEANLIDFVTDSNVALQNGYTWVVDGVENGTLKDAKSGYISLQTKVSNLGGATSGINEHYFVFNAIDATGNANESNILTLKVETLPSDAPIIHAQNLDLPASIIEGDELEEMIRVPMIAEGKIDTDNTTLSISNTSGLDETYKLNDYSAREVLWDNFGIAVDLVSDIQYDLYIVKTFTSTLSAPSDRGDDTYSIKIHLQDQENKTDVMTKTIGVKAPRFNLITNEGDAFAKRIILRTQFEGDEDRHKLTYQYKVNGNWENIPDQLLKRGGDKLWVDTLRNLTPVNNYSVRAVYNLGKKYERVSEEKIVSTERELFIEGGDMDSWTRTEHDKGSNGFVGNNVTIYNYINTSPYWHTNNKVGLDENPWPAVYMPYRCFPLVSYISDESEGKAASIRSMSIGTPSTHEVEYSDKRKRGLLYLGASDGVEGIEFASRPSALAFDYKFDAYDSDAFEIYAVVKNGDQVLGEASYSKADGKTEFERIMLPFEYTDFSKKADKIYIYFYSSTKEKPSVGKGVKIQMENGEYTAHAGGCLYIDNVNVVYD